MFLILGQRSLYLKLARAVQSIKGISRHLVSMSMRITCYTLLIPPCTAIPTNADSKPTEMHFPPGPREGALEQELIDKFGRRNFRQYLNISPFDSYQSSLKTLEINMVDLEKKPTEIRQMLAEARDERLRKVRNSKKRVTQQSLKETVTSPDVHSVIGSASTSRCEGV